MYVYTKMNSHKFTNCQKMKKKIAFFPFLLKKMPLTIIRMYLPKPSPGILHEFRLGINFLLLLWCSSILEREKEYKNRPSYSLSYKWKYTTLDATVIYFSASNVL